MRWTREEMLQALDRAYRIWDEESRSSKDALKATKALKRTLSNIRGTGATGNAQRQLPVSQTSSSSCERIPQTLQMSSNGAAATEDPHSWLMSSSIPQSYQSAEPGAFGATFGGIADMMNPMMELDWGLWDNHFHNNLNGTPPDLWSFDAGTFDYPNNPNNNENVMEWGY